jgi:hypothetical protein
MTLTTLRPHGTLANSLILAGGATLHAVLADNSDSTYAEASGSNIAGAVSFPAPSLPSGAVVKSQAIMVRTAKTGATANLRFDVLNPGAGPYAIVPIGSPTPVGYYLVALPSPMATPPVTGLNITALGVPSPVLRVYAVYLDVLYVEKPALVVDEPSASPVITTEPTISWTATIDPDGGAQARFDVKIFSAAQYGAGGFNPTSSPAVDASTVLTGPASSWTPSVPLADGNYRAYVRIAQIVNGAEHWSSWAYRAFTVEALKPAAPGLVVIPEHAAGRIRLEIEDLSTTPAADRFAVERSHDGVTWTALRTPATGITVADPVLWDFEAPIAVDVLYRARAINSDDDPVLLLSPWTVSAPTRWLSRRWWLKCPEIPALNIPVVIASQPARQRAARQTAFQPLGARLPIVVSDARSGWTGQLEIQVVSEADQGAIDELLDTDLTLLLQGPPADGEPDRYVRIGDHSRTRLADRAWVTARTDTLPWTEVAAPTGPLNAWPSDGGS